MKKIVVVMVCLLGLAAAPAIAGLSWDFADGLQGWTVSGPARWIDPNVEPNGPVLRDGAVSGGGAANVYCYDGSNIRIDISEYLVGGVTDKWFLQADFYIPNLLPTTGYYGSDPGDAIHRAGIWGLPSHGWPIGVHGDMSIGSCEYVNYPANDFAGQCSRRDLFDEVGPTSGWWDNWITVSIDYNLTQANVCTARMYIPWEDQQGRGPGWVTIYNGPTDQDGGGFYVSQFISTIVVGADPKYPSYAYTKTQVDNVYFDSPDLVPEPGGICALCAGLLGLRLRKRG